VAGGKPRVSRDVTAEEILDKFKEFDKWYCMGRKPETLKAAAEYLATLLRGERATQREIAERYGINEQTLRKHYRRMVSTLKVPSYIRRNTSLPCIRCGRAVEGAHFLIKFASYYRDSGVLVGRLCMRCADGGVPPLQLEELVQMAVARRERYT